MYKVIDKIVSVEDYDKYIKPKLNENPPKTVKTVKIAYFSYENEMKKFS